MFHAHWSRTYSERWDFFLLASVKPSNMECRSALEQKTCETPDVKDGDNRSGYVALWFLQYVQEHMIVSCKWSCDVGGEEQWLSDA